MNNKLLAESLLEWTRDSSTSFLTAEDKELVEKAAKLEIKLPSPDLAIFKTVYAEIDKPNRNRMLLSRKAVEAGLQTLKGKQINWEHFGSGHVCGYILDAKIEDDRIVIYGTLFKSLFKDEFEKVEELFQDKKLFVSFEIWNRNEKGESVLHALPHNIYAIDPIIFHGCGLLLEKAPACPNARVLKLLASEKIIEEANTIVEKVFEKDENLVYAEMAIEEPKCKGCNPCTCGKGGKQQIMAEEIKDETPVTVAEVATDQIVSETTPEAVVEEVKTEIPVEKSEEATPEVTPKPEETTVQAEVTVTEPATAEVTVSDAPVTEVKPKEEVAQVEATPENTEAAGVVTQTQHVIKTDEVTPDAEVVTTEVKTETVAVNDEGKETMRVENISTTVETYTRQQLEEKVAQTAEVKDKEIAQLKQELDTLRQEIESLKVVKAEEVVPDLTVGTVEVTERYKTIRKEIDKRAFGTK